MKKALAISLAVIFLMGNMSFTVVNHYCGGKVMESALALGHENLECGMAGMDENCESPQSDKTVIQKQCCENEYTTLDIEDDFVTSSEVVNLNQTFVFAFVYTYLESIVSEKEATIAYTTYSPPQINPDIQVLHQNFLI